jgi:hypothetical protein
MKKRRGGPQHNRRRQQGRYQDGGHTRNSAPTINCLAPKLASIPPDELAVLISVHGVPVPTPCSVCTATCALAPASVAFNADAAAAGSTIVIKCFECATLVDMLSAVGHTIPGGELRATEAAQEIDDIRRRRNQNN